MVSLYWDGASGMFMSGPGFSMAVQNSLWGAPMLVPVLQAGTMADADWFFPDSRGVPMGYATVGGVPITNEDHPLGYVNFGGNLIFDAAPFLVTDADPTAAYVSFSTTFTMSGVLSGYGGAAPGTSGPLLFSIPLQGQGTTTITMMRREETGEGVFFYPTLANQSFVFQTEQTPVPEPASMVLLGTGLTGLALRRRHLSMRQRRSRSS